MADKNMEQVMEKAQVLIEALPYLFPFQFQYGEAGWKKKLTASSLFLTLVP